MILWGKWEMRDVTAPERMVYVNSFSDEKGGTTRHPFSASWPLQTLTTLTFDEVPGGKSRLTLQWVPIDATQEEIDTFNGAHDGMKQGWSGTMEQLDAYLAGTN
jgi:uncharacterized protein YndB with AHSA1/START domain